MEVQATEVLRIVALSSAVALATEAVMWLWAFRRDSFRTLRVGMGFLLDQDALALLANRISHTPSINYSFNWYCLRVQTSIDKQARKLEELRAAPHAPGAAGKAAKQKKVDKLDRAIKSQMAKELGSVKMKQALVVRSQTPPFRVKCSHTAAEHASCRSLCSCSLLNMITFMLPLCAADGRRVAPGLQAGLFLVSLGTSIGAALLAKD